MRYRTAFFTVATVLVLVGLYHYTFSSPWRVTPEVAKMLLDAKKIDLVLDVRTPLERETLGKYPGSSHIPSGELNKVVLDRVRDRGTVILVYCNTGQRARHAVEVLRELRYKHVMYIAGSWKSIT